MPSTGVPARIAGKPCSVKLRPRFCVRRIAIDQRTVNIDEEADTDLMSRGL